MNDAQTSPSMSPGLQKVAERARKDPATKFYSLAHLIDAVMLRRSYGRLRKNAAVGVDGVTKEKYGQELGRNLQSLHERMKAKKYRHQAIRRVHIPKTNGKSRPIGISTTEDKVVQTALREVLETIYEQDFYSFSYGFRPGRSAHGAVHALTRAVDEGKANVILEIDLAGYFDSIDREKLVEILQKRVGDESVLRLIRKCLHVGILDGEEFSRPERGTVQGSTLSPLLGNIYLHYVLDEWFEEEVKPRLRGKAVLVRYADDGVFGFERRDDAERVKVVLEKRLAKFGLSLNLDKTRLLNFRKPSRSQQDGKGPSTFEFLGFLWYYRRVRAGWWSVACKTMRARITRAIRSVYDWCRSHRCLPVKEQHAALTARLRGHYNYFGISGNVRSLEKVAFHAQCGWYKWLNRRSQRARLNGKRYQDMLRTFPLPKPRVVVNIWR